MVISKHSVQYAKEAKKDAGGSKESLDEENKEEEEEFKIDIGGALKRSGLTSLPRFSSAVDFKAYIVF
jgi:hypothetical protein